MAWRTITGGHVHGSPGRLPISVASVAASTPRGQTRARLQREAAVMTPLRRPTSSDGEIDRPHGGRPSGFRLRSTLICPWFLVLVVRGKATSVGGRRTPQRADAQCVGKTLEVPVMVQDVEPRSLCGDRDREFGERQPVSAVRAAARESAHRREDATLDRAIDRDLSDTFQGLVNGGDRLAVTQQRLGRSAAFVARLQLRLGAFNSQPPVGWSRVLAQWPELVSSTAIGGRKPATFTGKVKAWRESRPRTRSRSPSRR